MVAVLTKENPTLSNPIFGAVLIACSVLIWPLSNAFTKLLYAENALTLIFWVVFLRGLLSYGMGCYLSHKRGQYIPIKEVFQHPHIKTGIVRGCAGAMNNIMLLIALVYLTFVEATALLFMSPFMLLILAPLVLGAEFKLPNIMAVITAPFGLLVALDIPHLSSEQATYGFTAGLLAGLFMAIFALTNYKNEKYGVHLALRTSGICYMVLGLLGLIIAGGMGLTHAYLLDLGSFSWGQMLILLGAVGLHFVGSVIGQRGFKYTPPLLASTIVYMELLWAVVIQHFLLGGLEERNSAWIGLIIIATAGIGSVYFNNKKQKYNAKI